MRDTKPTSLLLIEGDRESATHFEELLRGPSPESPSAVEIIVADRLSTGLVRLTEGGIDVVILELDLPDGQGLESVKRVREHGPDAALIVLSNIEDEATALLAVRAGAQDYLVKGRIGTDGVTRAIKYAQERHRMQVALREMAVIDPLTGLHNRRGFFTLAEHALKVSQRSGRGFVLLLADLDGLKAINDGHGHAEGDRAVIETAATLRRTFRRSDILGRLGGDEFGVVALDAPAPVLELLISRLESGMQEASASRDRGYILSATFGAAAYDPVQTTSVDQLLILADTMLYERKPSALHPFRRNTR
jgi:two-component system, cell cycle response regulator